MRNIIYLLLLRKNVLIVDYASLSAVQRLSYCITFEIAKQATDSIIDNIDHSKARLISVIVPRVEKNSRFSQS